MISMHYVHDIQLATQEKALDKVRNSFGSVSKKMFSIATCFSVKAELMASYKV